MMPSIDDNLKIDLMLTAKLVVLGDENVGKTSLTRRYCHGIFYEGRAMTNDVSSYQRIKVMTRKVNEKSNSNQVHGEVCRLQIWDTLGQEKYRCMNSAYYRGADAAVIVYDCSEIGKDHMATVKSWINELHDYLPETTPIWIVANKLDLALEKKVKMKHYPYNIVAKYAEQKGYGFFKTSAKTDESGTEAIFDDIAAKMWPRLKARFLRNNNLTEIAHSGDISPEQGGERGDPGRGFSAELLNEDQRHFDTFDVFDDDNSKDVGRRTMAM